MNSASALLQQAKRITVKVGSALLMREASGPRLDWLNSVVADLVTLCSSGKKLVIVSSGAVAVGRITLKLPKPRRLSTKQALAAAGQIELMQMWNAAFSHHGKAIGQLLLTIEDTEDRRRWINAKNTVEELWFYGITPVVNENDSVSTEEIRYGDNDRLAARVAQLTQCDLLIILSDVDGLFTTDPKAFANATHIPFVPCVTPEIRGLAGESAWDGSGIGGMKTKLLAAEIASASGCATIIASGRHDHPVQKLADGGLCTVFAASETPQKAYKRWIASSLVPAGALVIDDGAVAALHAGKSLLSAGLVGVSGEYQRGACVEIRSSTAELIGRGIVAYGAAEARLIAGKATKDIEAHLGYCRSPELIHRDDLVLMS